MEATTLVLVGSVCILVFGVLILVLWSSRVQTVGPNEVLIISGRPNVIMDSQGNKHEVGFRVVKGGRSFIWPIIEKCEKLSLELMTLEIQTPEVVTKEFVPILVDGVAQIKFKGEDFAIITAAEQFLGKSRSEVMTIAHQTLEGHLRAILGTMNVEELISNRDMFAQRVQEVSSPDLGRMGLVILSFTIKDIRDKVEYLETLSKRAIAERQGNAAVGQANASSEAEIRRSEAQAKAVEESSKFQKQAQVKKLGNDAEIAQAARDFKIKNAEFEASVNQKKAAADSAYGLQKFKQDQLIKAEEMQVMLISKQKEIEIQKQEIERKKFELEAMVEQPAMAERRNVESLASAEMFKLKATADGESESTRMKGLARADVERAEGNAAADVQKAKGLADAEVQKAHGVARAEVTKLQGLAEANAIQARGLAEAESRKAIGLAEAEAMEKKATAWRSYSEAAISQLFIDKLPEIVRAVAEPLSRTERIVMISSGNESGVGASKLTKEILDVVTQVPAALEAVTGVDLQAMIGHMKNRPIETSAPPAEPPAKPDDGKNKGTPPKKG